MKDEEAMNEKRNDRSDIVPVGGEAPPSWMTGYEDDKSLESMKEHRQLSRISVVQALSGEEVKEQFGEGAAYLSPAMVQVCPKKEGFKFVPVMFMAEYIAWNDRDDGSSGPIHERSFDSKSDIAYKCKSSNLREEEYGEGFTRRYCEHLNFCGFIYGGDQLDRTPVVLGFSRGEHGTGSAMISATFLRKAPLWAQVWNAQSAFRDKGPKKKWWGLSMTPSGFITEEEAEFFEGQHKELTEAFEQQRLSVDRTDEAPESKPKTDEM